MVPAKQILLVIVMTMTMKVMMMMVTTMIMMIIIIYWANVWCILAADNLPFEEVMGYFRKKYPVD